MKSSVIVVIATVAAAIACAGVFVIMSQGGAGGGEDDETLSDSPLNWAYFGGDVGNFGVTDSKTPISEDQMILAWKTTDAYMDPSGGTWRVPSSALCVGDSVYYFNGYDNNLFRCDVHTGKVLAKITCVSDAVFSMALAYGDGKIFVCAADGTTATVAYAYDAIDLKQLFRTVSVRGEQVEGTITYNDGKIYFGTYAGDYACFRADDVDKNRSDEIVEPLWLVDADGWYNATPAFLDDYVVIVKRGFDDLGATALMIEADTGAVIDSVFFDREFSSSGPTAYEGRIYIPLMKVIDRSDLNPDQFAPKHLSIHSFEMTSKGFNRDSERQWESDCPSGGTQSMATIWNDTIYIGGGGSTMGSDEPFCIVDIGPDDNMSTRCIPRYINDNGEESFICTKATPVITTAYSTKDNGYAVYIYLMEYGHVNPGEKPDSTKGYADLFVIRDSKTEGTEIVVKLRPEPSQFCFQSFSVSEEGYLLIKNDTTLFCYKGLGNLDSADIDSAIDRFIDMAGDGHVNYVDYQRIVARYSILSDTEKGKVTNYSRLQSLCCDLTLRSSSGDVVISVPKGSIVDIPDVDVPSGMALIGWECNGSEWASFCTPVVKDTVLTPVYKEIVTVTVDPQNGGAIEKIRIAKDSVLPYIPLPTREGFEFDGWMCGDIEYVPTVSKVAFDITIKAVWPELSVLSFDTDGGSAVTGKYTAVYGKPIKNLPRTEKAGNRFVGWSYDGKMYDVDTVYPFKTPVTLKAIWMESEIIEIGNGNGLYVSGRLAEDSSVKVYKLGSGGYSGKAIIATLGTDSADLLRVRIISEGLDSTVVLGIRIDVKGDHDGEAPDVCYYLDDKTVMTKGLVNDGKLVFELKGDSTYDGVEILLGTASGLGVSECVG